MNCRRKRDEFVGKTIRSVEETNRGHLLFTFTDGSVCEISGIGYDGLWDDVIAIWKDPEGNDES